MKRLFVLCIMCVALSLSANAQSACEKYYAAAVKCQQTMTIASQKQAIANFEKAMNCYDSEQKKELCKSQIATCKNTIALIKKMQQEAAQKQEEGKKAEDSLVVVKEEKPEIEEKVILSASETILKFKSKGDEFLKFKVNCNYEDWKVVDKPDWISYSIGSDNEIVCEASKNPDKDERQGMIVIECKGTSVSVAVLQSKKGLLDKISEVSLDIK